MKIALVSFFISDNLGDLAISSAIVDMLKNKDKNIEIYKYDFSKVMSINQEKGREDRASKKSINKSSMMFFEKLICKIKSKVNQWGLSLNWRRLKNDLKDSDMMIIGGGNMIMDLVPGWPILFARFCKIANSTNTPYHIIYVGVGPINNKKSELIYKRAFETAEYVSVRGPLSKNNAKNFSNNIIETIDPVFGLELDLLNHRIKQITSQKSKTINVGVCVLGKVCFKTTEEHLLYLERVMEIIIKTQEALNKHLMIHVFSTDHKDYDAVNEISGNLSEIKTTHNLITHEISNIHEMSDLIEFYKKLDFLIGGRMHSLIFSQMCLLPYIGIEWQEKLVEFSKITSNEKSIYSFENFNSDNINLISNVINNISNIDKTRKMNSKNLQLKKIVDNGMSVKMDIH